MNHDMSSVYMNIPIQTLAIFKSKLKQTFLAHVGPELSAYKRPLIRKFRWDYVVVHESKVFLLVFSAGSAFAIFAVSKLW